MLEAETTEQFLVHCPRHLIHRNALLDRVNNLFSELSSKSDTVRILLYGNEELDDKSQRKIIEATICFLEKTGRFDIPFMSNDPTS